MCKFRAQARLSLTVIYDESRELDSPIIFYFFALRVRDRSLCGVQQRFGEFSDNRAARFSPAIARLIPHVDKAR